MMNNIKAASVQFNHSPGNKSYNLKRIHEFAKVASEQNVDIVAFPEMCVTGYWYIRNLSKDEIKDLAEPVQDGQSTRELLSFSSKYNITIGAGLIEQANDGNMYNTYVVAMPDGNIAYHRKLHCFISKHMVSGNDYTVFDIPQGARVGVLICYDNNITETWRAKDEMVVADLDPSLLDMCTGQRWIKSRRPTLYKPLAELTGKEEETRKVRFTMKDKTK